MAISSKGYDNMIFSMTREMCLKNGKMRLSNIILKSNILVPKFLNLKQGSVAKMSCNDSILIADS